MRRFDSRAWNLGTPSLLLASVACGPPGIPADEDVGEGENTDTIGPECTVDADCASGYYCLAETCQPIPYSDWSDNTEYTDYSDYSDYSDYNDDWNDDYSDWTYECYTNADCPPGYECVYNECQYVGIECYTNADCPPNYVCDNSTCSYVGSIDEPTECEAPPITEIPLPELGLRLDIAFADLDADGRDELVLLDEAGVLVVQGDDTLVATAWSLAPALPLTQIALLSLDGDAALDLVAFPQLAGPAQVALGDGMFGFTTLGEILDAPRVERMHGYDGEQDGSERLVALRPDLDRVTQFSDPTLLSGNNTLIGPVGASDLDVGQLDLSPAPDLLIGTGCTASVLLGAGLNPSLALPGPQPNLAGVCEWHGARFLGAPVDDALAVFNAGSSGLVFRVRVETMQSWALQLGNGFGASAVARLDGADDYVLMSDAEQGRVLWAWDDDNGACIADLPFAGTPKFAIGDRDGDGREEVLTLDAMGQVRLWKLP